MSSTTDRTLPKPSDFFRGAWRAAKRVPGLFVLRAAYDIFAMVFRFAALFAVTLPFAIHFATHLATGGTLLAWPERMLAALLQPESLLGLAGLAFVAWLLLFAAEALTAAGIWGGITKSLSRRETSPFATPFSAAVERFAEALPQRVLSVATNLTLSAVTVGTCVTAYITATMVSQWSNSTVVLPAATWALFLTILACCVVIVRLTVELVAAPLFMERVGLGEAIVRAAETVVAHPVHLYRVFIVAAAVLIPPLVLYWFAIILQNVSIELGGMTGLTTLIRLATEVVLLVGVAAFIVMFNASLFTYYAWWTGTLDEDAIGSKPRTPPRTPSLQELLPESYDTVVDVADILEPWTEDETLPRPSVDSSPPESTPDDGPFSLDAILDSGEEE